MQKDLAPLPTSAGLQFNSLRSKFPGIDIQEMESQFVVWNAEKGAEPENYVGAPYEFIKRKQEREG